MKASRKVFAVLSVALPLMLVASMTARAEDGGTSGICRMENEGYIGAYYQCYDGLEKRDGSSTSCKSSETWQKYAEEFCKGHCNSTTGKCGVNTFTVGQTCGGTKVCDNTCPNVDEMVRKCTANNMTYKKWMDEKQCTRIECVRDGNSTSSSSSCPDATSAWNRCMNSGGTPTSFLGDNGCKVVKCANSSTSTSTGGGSVNCKRTIVNNCKVYTCDDGSVERVCGNSQDKPKTLPPAPKGPCTDIERTIVEVKAALEKNPSSLELQKKLEEVSKRFTACRLQSQSSSSISSSGTTNTACKTEVVGSCKVTRCPGGRSFRVCS